MQYIMCNAFITTSMAEDKKQTKNFRVDVMYIALLMKVCTYVALMLHYVS
jgi:hypothetical protein